ncbi:MAG: beta-lactamase family protein, partial [Flavobacteriales bacterium]|nr:beta-lactamase family protein [Flavobacteriales bacterium]
MKNYLLILISVLYFNSYAQEADVKKSLIGDNTNRNFLSVHKHFKSKFETEISNIFKNNHIEGDFIFGIVDETGLVYSYALNKEILEKKTTSLTNDSPIYIASHTKAMTGTLLKILEEEGKIDLDKTLYHYLPELTFKGKVDTESITVRNLLNHTHSISNGIVTFKTAYFGYSGDTQELINDFNQSSKINTSKKFRYSNI